VSAPPSRRRRRTATGEQILAELDRMIPQLIAENRQLKRRLDSLRSGATATASKSTERVLRSLQRKVSSAVGDTSGAGGRRGREPVAAQARPRRKITDPEVLARRRQALAKARAVRAAKLSGG
jgi:hypothetical protein